MFDDSCYMEPLHLAGRLIMENGGETCRVEETVLRMGHAVRLPRGGMFRRAKRAVRQLPQERRHHRDLPSSASAARE